MFLFDNCYMNMDTWTINLLQDAFWKKKWLFWWYHCRYGMQSQHWDHLWEQQWNPHRHWLRGSWQLWLAESSCSADVDLGCSVLQVCVMGLVFIFSNVNFMPFDYLLSQCLFIQNRTLYHKRAYQNIISDSFTNTV